jgi:hypothetical protein
MRFNVTTIGTAVATDSTAVATVRGALNLAATVHTHATYSPAACPAHRIASTLAVVPTTLTAANQPGDIRDVPA